MGSANVAEALESNGVSVANDDHGFPSSGVEQLVEFQVGAAAGDPEELSLCILVSPDEFTET